jgi:hypothetical protein
MHIINVDKTTFNQRLQILFAGFLNLGACPISAIPPDSNPLRESFFRFELTETEEIPTNTSSYPSQFSINDSAG